MVNSIVEEKAEVSAQFFAHLLQNMSSGMIVIDEDGRVTSANQTAASLLGYDVNEMIDLPYQQFWPENLLPLNFPNSDRDLPGNLTASQQRPFSAGRPHHYPHRL
jgi:PAS domain S-box-containing protein